MHHKRGKPKNARAGCLMCKPNKVNGVNKNTLGHRGFGKLRAAIHSARDLKTYDLLDPIGGGAPYYVTKTADEIFEILSPSPEHTSTMRAFENKP